MESTANMSQLPEGFITEVATRYGVTQTELDALLMALNDCSGAQIAVRLQISQAAVRKRLGESYRKFGIEGSGNKKLNNLKQNLLTQYQAVSATSFEDWGEAVDVDGFWGREAEILKLEQWIVGDDSQFCRLVAVLGIGGVGKTVLAARVAKKVQRNFDFLFWRSLHNAPSLSDILTQLLQFLPKDAEPELPDNENSKILRVIDALKKHRCLVIFDKVEAVLRSGEGRTYERAGEYEQGYEKYGYLFKKVAEAGHKSCLLLIGREKPKQVALLEGKNLPVKVLNLGGLNLEEARAMLYDKGFSCSDAQLRELVNRYSGNPLALKIVATTVYDLFSNNITEFLNQIQQETAVYGDFRAILDKQFNRLSELEKQLMYWLAIHRENVSLIELKDDLLTIEESAVSVLEAVESLLRRSLIEKESDSGRFRQQFVVMEYVTEQFIEKVVQEMRQGNCLGFFDNYSLMKARSLDYIRKTQQRLILEPVTKRLASAFGSKELESHLRRMLANLQQHSPLQRGYAAGNLINMLRQLQINQPQIDLSGRDFSNLTICQAYLKDVNLQDTSFTNANLTGSAFAETMSSIASVRFSPDGEYFATGVLNGEVRLWRTSDIRQLRIYRGHTGLVWAFSFSLDSKTLASGSADYTIRLWDVHTGECLRTLKEHTNQVYSLAFHPEGDTLASAGEDQTIKLWDVNTGDCVKTLKGHTGWVGSIAFSPTCEDTLASSSADGTIKLWNINTGECLKTLKGHTGKVYSVNFHPDGQFLASGSEDQSVKLWDISSGTSWKTLKGHSKKVYSVRFSPDGNILASSGEDRTIKLWDVYTSKHLRNLLGHTSQVWAIAFSPDGQTLISGSDDQTARLWDVATGNCLNVLQGYTRGVYSVAFNPDSDILASGSDDHTIRLWDVRTGECYTIGEHQGRIRSVTCSPNGQLLASGGADNHVKLWEIADITNRKCIKTLEGHTNWVWSVAFSPNGQTLASSSEDQTIRVWDIYTGECLQVFEGHSHWVWTVAFSPNGQTLASGSVDSTVKLWDICTGECIQTLGDHQDLVRSVAFSPDGKILASGSEDQTVRLWDLSSYKCQILQGHSKPVYSVAFSPEGQTLATGSGDETIKLWQVSTGVCLDTLTRGHTAAIRSVAFSADGQLLASGSEDENIQLWDVNKCTRVRQMKSDRLYERMEITGITGLTDAEKASLKALGAVEQVERAFH